MDQSLDDIIAANKSSRRGRGGSRGGRGRGRGRGGRRGGGNGGARSAPYTKAPVPDAAWSHDLYGGVSPAVVIGGGMAAVGGLSTGGKLTVSNLDFGVNDVDIKELFGKFGTLKKAFVHYDRAGRSQGSATVVFASKNSALAAIREYNNVALDGKPMQIELVSNEAAAPVVAAAPPVVGYQPQHRIPRPRRGRGAGAAPKPARGGGRGRGRGKGRGGRTAAPQKTLEELNAELESYKSAAASEPAAAAVEAPAAE